MRFLDIFNRSSKTEAGSAGNSSPADIRFSPRVVHQLDRLMLNTSRFLLGFSTGLRSSTRRRPQLEFREHRMYTPGDDVRFVDWKASARQEHIFVKQGEHQKEASVFVLLDCSASMGWGSPPKSAMACRLASMFGYLALTHGDRFFLAPFQNEIIQPLGPVNGKGQIPLLLRTLRSLSFKGSSELLTIGHQLRRRFGSSSGLLLVISDMIDLADPAAFLDLFRAPGWDVVMVHLLHPAEVNPDFSGDYECQDIETGRKANLDITPKDIAAYRHHIDEWKDKLNLACVEKNAFYLFIEAAGQDDLQLIARLRELHLLRPV